MTDTSNCDPCPKLFSLGQMIFGSIVGSPIAGLVMMTWNHFALKETKRVYLTLLIGVVAHLIYFVATFLYFYRIPTIFHVVVPAILFSIAAYCFQDHVEKRIMQSTALRVTIPTFILVCFFVVLAAGLTFYAVFG